ncbi:MAG: hypothetical protein ACFHWX_22915 [Bacteroidota bacterium]
MKNLFKSLFLLAIVASLGFFTSCNEDSEELPDLPVVSFTSSVLDDTGYASLQPGDVLSFTISVNAPGVFNNLKMNYYQDGVEVADSDSTISRDPGTSPLEYTTDQFSFEITNEDVGIVHTLVFQAVDDASQLSNELTLTIDVTSPDARVYAAFLLAAPLANDAGTPDVDERTSLTWFSTNLGVRISSASVVSSESSSADVDFGYYYLQADGLSLAAPSAYPNGVYDLSATGQQWGTLNSTALRSTTLNATSFAEVTSFADIDAEFEAGTEEANVKKDLAVGDVIAFQTDADKTGGSKKGLILVTELVDANANGVYWDENDGIKIEVIVQESAL